MSYEIVRSISIKGEDVLVTSASNNLRPLTYEKWSINGASLSEKIGKVIYYILLGEFHFNYTNSQLSIWNYITRTPEYQTARQRLEEKEIDNEETKNYINKVLVDMYYNLKNEDVKGKYVLKTKEGNYITKVSNYSYGYGYWKEDAKVFKHKIEARFWSERIDASIEKLTDED